VWGDCKVVKGALASCIAAVGLLPLAAQAQRVDDAWHWRASIYGWFPAIGGSASYPTGGSGPSLDFDSADVLPALKFTFMGALDACKAELGAFIGLTFQE